MAFSKISKSDVQTADGARKVYSIINNNIITLYNLKKNIKTEPHKHPHRQFEYCMKGEYEVNVNQEKYLAQEKFSHSINGFLPHAYYSLKGAYFFCFNFFANNINEDIVDCQFQQLEASKDYTIEKIALETTSIYKINTQEKNVTINLDLNRKYLYFLISSGKNYIIAEKIKNLVFPMEIYNIIVNNDDLLWRIKYPSEILVVELLP